MKTLLTVPIQARDPAKIRDILKKKQSVDAYEIWLDSLDRRHLRPEIIENLVTLWRKSTSKKLVIVCKNPSEKGGFTGSHSQKVELLSAAARAGAHYIDAGLHTGKISLRKLCKEKKRSKLIISFHDFGKTPDINRLRSFVEKMMDLGADIVKIATFVNRLEDNEKLLQLALDLKKEHQSHIILGMGEMGIATRILGQKMGNELQFGALDVKTAPGQLTLEQMLHLRKVLS